MAVNPCPVCDSTTAPKFDQSSDWCEQCARGELGMQALEARDHVERHEVIHT